MSGPGFSGSAKRLNTPINAFRPRRTSISGESLSSNGSQRPRERRASLGALDSDDGRAKLAAGLFKKAEHQKSDTGDIFSTVFKSVQLDAEEELQNQLQQNADKPTENDDLPYWGPGILFYIEQKSRQVKVLSVLERPAGPGHTAGVKRGDILIAVDALNEDVISSMAARKVMQAVLGERGTKVRMGIMRIDQSSGMGMKFEVTLPRQHFQSNDTEAHPYGVVSVTILSCRDLSYTGSSCCRLSVLSNAPGSRDTDTPLTMSPLSSPGVLSSMAGKRESYRHFKRQRESPELSSNTAGDHGIARDEDGAEHRAQSAVSSSGWSSNSFCEKLELASSLWTRPVSHSVKPLRDPRWGTRMHFRISDSKKQSISLALFRCQDDAAGSVAARDRAALAENEEMHYADEALPNSFPKLHPPDSGVVAEPVAELHVTIAEIASGFATSGKGVNNWFRLDPPPHSQHARDAPAQRELATNASFKSASGGLSSLVTAIGHIRVQFTWLPAASLGEADEMIKDAIEKERERGKREHVLVKGGGATSPFATMRMSSRGQSPVGVKTKMGKQEELSLQLHAQEEIKEGIISEMYHSSILMACRSTSLSRVKNLIYASSACLLLRDQTGKNALHIAAMNEHEIGPRMVEQILRVDVTLAQEMDMLGQTPLHLACQNKGPTSELMSDRWSGDLEPCIHRLVPLLLDAAPESALIQDCDGLVPLDFAVRNPHPRSLEAVKILLNRCRQALRPEVLEVDLHSEWSKLSEFSSSSVFGGKTITSELSVLCQTLPDGIEAFSNDVIKGYNVDSCSTDASVSYSEALLLAMAFDAFASMTIKFNKSRKLQQREIKNDVNIAIASARAKNRFDSDESGDAGLVGELRNSAGSLDRVCAKWSLASESRHELLPIIMRIQDMNLPPISTHLLATIEREKRYVTYRIADPLTHFQRLPVHLCCLNSAPHIPQLLPVLLDHDPHCGNVPNWDKQLALHVACANTSPDADVIVKQLLDCNPDSCTGQEARGMLPLHIACSNAGPASARIVRMLLAAHKDGAACLDGEGRYPIDHAIVCPSLAAGEMVTLLVDAFPAAALRLNKFGQTILHQALIAALLPLSCVTNSIPPDIRADLLECFFSIDEDGSGRIELPELVAALKSMGIEMDEDEAKEMLRDIDTDGNYELDFAEFIEFINQNFLTIRRDDILVSSEHILDHRNHMSTSHTQAPHAPDLVKALLDCSARIPKAELPDDLLEKCVYQAGHSPFASTPDVFGRCPLFYASASRAKEAAPIIAKLIEHFPAGGAQMDVTGDTALHYAAAVANVSVANALVNGVAGRKSLPQHVSNMTGRLPIDLAVSLALRLVLSSNTGFLTQSLRHAVLVLFSVLHMLLNFAWAVSYLNSGVSFTVYYIVFLYSVGVGGILLLLYLRSHGRATQRDQDDHGIVVFKRYEAFIVLMPLALMHAFAAVRLEDRGQEIPFVYWIGIIFSLLAWTVTTVTLDGSLCHATMIPRFAKLLEIVVVTAYRMAEKLSRIAILSLLLLEYSLCPCEPPGYDSFNGCYCYSNFLGPTMLFFEFLFQLYLLSGITLPSHKFTHQDDPKRTVRSVYLRALINLVGVHYGRVRGTTISNFMLKKSANYRSMEKRDKHNESEHGSTHGLDQVGSVHGGRTQSEMSYEEEMEELYRYQASYTSSFLGEVRIWDTILMVIARAANHLILFFILSTSDGMRQIIDNLRLRDLSVADSRRAVVETYVMIAGFGTILSWVFLLLRYLVWKYSSRLVKKRAVQQREQQVQDEAFGEFPENVIARHHTRTFRLGASQRLSRTRSPLAAHGQSFLERRTSRESSAESAGNDESSPRGSKTSGPRSPTAPPAPKSRSTSPPSPHDPQRSPTLLRFEDEESARLSPRRLPERVDLQTRTWDGLLRRELSTVVESPIGKMQSRISSPIPSEHQPGELALSDLSNGRQGSTATTGETMSSIKKGEAFRAPREDVLETPPTEDDASEASWSLAEKQNHTPHDFQQVKELRALEANVPDQEDGLDASVPAAENPDADVLVVANPLPQGRSAASEGRPPTPDDRDPRMSETRTGGSLRPQREAQGPHGGAGGRSRSERRGDRRSTHSEETAGKPTRRSTSEAQGERRRRHARRSTAGDVEEYSRELEKILSHCKPIPSALESADEHQAAITAVASAASRGHAQPPSGPVSDEYSAVLEKILKHCKLPDSVHHPGSLHDQHNPNPRRSQPDSDPRHPQRATDVGEPPQSCGVGVDEQRLAAAEGHRHRANSRRRSQRSRGEPTPERARRRAQEEEGLVGAAPSPRRRHTQSVRPRPAQTPDRRGLEAGREGGREGEGGSTVLSRDASPDGRGRAVRAEAHALITGGEGGAGLGADSRLAGSDGSGRSRQLGSTLMPNLVLVARVKGEGSPCPPSPREQKPQAALEASNVQAKRGERRWVEQRGGEGGEVKERGRERGSTWEAVKGLAIPGLQTQDARYLAETPASISVDRRESRRRSRNRRSSSTAIGGSDRRDGGTAPASHATAGQRFGQSEAAGVSEQQVDRRRSFSDVTSGVPPQLSPSSRDASPQQGSGRSAAFRADAALQRSQSDETTPFRFRHSPALKELQRIPSAPGPSQHPSANAPNPSQHPSAQPSRHPGASAGQQPRRASPHAVEPLSTLAQQQRIAAEEVQLQAWAMDPQGERRPVCCLLIDSSPSLSVHAAAEAMLGRSPASLRRTLYQLLAAVELATPAAASLKTLLRLSGGPPHEPSPPSASFLSRLRQLLGDVVGGSPPSVVASGWRPPSRSRSSLQGDAAEFVVELDMGLHGRAQVAAAASNLLEQVLTAASTLGAFLAEQGGWRLGATSVHLILGSTLVSLTTNPPGSSHIIRVLARPHLST